MKIEWKEAMSAISMKRIKRNFELILILGTFFNLIFLGFISIGYTLTIAISCIAILLIYAIMCVQEII